MIRGNMKSIFPLVFLVRATVVPSHMAACLPYGVARVPSVFLGDFSLDGRVFPSPVFPTHPLPSSVSVLPGAGLLVCGSRFMTDAARDELFRNTEGLGLGRDMAAVWEMSTV